MAYQIIQNVRISGISACVPKNRVENIDAVSFNNVEEYKRFALNVGIERRHVADNDTTCSDMCLKAAEELIKVLTWDKKDIDLLVFVSQSPDYILPATSCVLHGKLGLSENCSSFDISLGCSGWVYGISVVGAMLKSGGYKKALLLVGDTRNKCKSPVKGNADNALFGDSGSATAMEYDETADEIKIESFTDGTGHEAIIIREGAARHPFNSKSLELCEDKHGNVHRPIDTEMDGAAVFIFAITKVPRAVKSLLSKTGKEVDDIDFFFFHQANRMLNEQVRKKCKIPVEKCPYSLRDFGNNSSVSIPLTIITQTREQLQNMKSADIVACGFGVGLSWATMHTRLSNIVIPPLLYI